MKFVMHHYVLLLNIPLWGDIRLHNRDFLPWICCHDNISMYVLSVYLVDVLGLLLCLQFFRQTKCASACTTIIGAGLAAMHQTIL